MATVRAYPKMIRPTCRTCRYYEKGRCRLFVENISKNEIMYAKIELARLDENLCGPEGMFWASPDFDTDQMWYSDNHWSPPT
jgi:hypothetical protein